MGSHRTIVFEFGENVSLTKLHMSSESFHVRTVERVGLIGEGSSMLVERLRDSLAEFTARSGHEFTLHVGCAAGQSDARTHAQLIT